MVSAGCVLTCGQPATRTIPPLTTAAARNGHRVGQVGLNHPVPRRDWAGETLPPVVLRVVDADARVAQHRHRHRRRAAPTAPTRRCARSSGRRRTPRRDSSSPETNCDDARSVDLDRAAGHGLRPAHRERQAVAVDVHAEAAQRVEQWRDRAGPGLLVAVEHHRRRC